MKGAASSLDYLHLVREMQDLLGSRIDKIYQEEDLFVWQLYTGKQRPYLVIDIPEVLYLTSTKLSFPKPKGFCMFLRKHLQSGRLVSIEQVGFDRIIKLVVQTKQRDYHVYLEQFSKGNLVVCDEQDKILSLLRSENFQERTLRGGVQYQLPPSQPDVPSMSEDELASYFGEEQAVIVLARDLGLGGQYAEIILERSGIEKTTKEPDVHRIHEKLHELLKAGEPEVKDGQAYPVHLYEDATPMPGFCEAIASVRDQRYQQARAEKQVRSAKKQLSRHENILEQQEQHIKGFENAAATNQRKAELLYEHYQEIMAFYEQARTDRKELDEEEFKRRYQEPPIIKQATKRELTIEVGEDA